MPSLSASQHSFLDQLYSACGNATIDIERYLSEHYFTNASGRALILQPAGGFGYFYLAPSLFEAAESRNRELSDFIGVVAILNELAADGLIYYLRRPDEPKGKEPVHVLGERFGSPSVQAGKLILNKQGDFTDQPRTIKNSAGTEIFYGIRFEGRLFELVNGAVRGTVHVTPGVARLDDTGTPPGVAKAGTVAEGTDAPAISSSGAPQDAPGSGRVSKKAVVGALGLALASVVLLAAQLYETYSIARGIETLHGALRASIEGGTRQAGAAPPRAPTGPPHESDAPAPIKAPAAPVAHAQPADNNVAFGFDISKWNSNLAEKALATPHVSFVIVRASAGMSKDFDFDANWALLKKYAIARGAYHFYKVSEDPVAQANHFLAAIGKPGDLTIAPVVDFEELSFDTGSASQKAEVVQARLLQALHVIEAATKRTPILYTNINTGNKYLADPRFSRYPLWIADWTNKDAPELPIAWKSVGFTYWQRSSSYTLPGGGSVPIDLDIYRSPTLSPVAPSPRAGASVQKQ